MDDLNVTGSEADEENTEDLLAGSVIVDATAGDDLSNNDNDDDCGRLEAGDDVSCNDEFLAALDENFSKDLVVIVTIVTGSEAAGENAEDLLAGSVTVDANAGDDLSNNDTDNDSGRLEAGDDVKCNDELLGALDENFSIDLVVIVTIVGLPLDVLRGLTCTACETVLLTTVGINTDENVTCDEVFVAGSEEETTVSRTDKNEDDSLTVKGDCTCSVDGEINVIVLLEFIDTDDSCCDDIAGDISWEELVPVIICDEVLGMEDVTAVVIIDEVDNP